MSAAGFILIIWVRGTWAPSCYCTCEGKPGETGCTNVGTMGPKGAQECMCLNNHPNFDSGWCMHLIGTTDNYDYRGCSMISGTASAGTKTVPQPFKDLITKAQSNLSMTCQTGSPDAIFNSAINWWQKDHGQNPYKLCVCPSVMCNMKSFSELMAYQTFAPGFQQSDSPVPGASPAPGGGSGTGGGESGNDAASPGSDKAGNGSATTSSSAKKETSGSNTPIIIGVVIGLMVILGAAAGYFVYKKRQEQADEGGGGSEGTEEEAEEE